MNKKPEDRWETLTCHICGAEVKVELFEVGSIDHYWLPENWEVADNDGQFYCPLDLDHVPFTRSGRCKNGTFK